MPQNCLPDNPSTTRRCGKCHAVELSAWHNIYPLRTPTICKFRKRTVERKPWSPRMRMAGTEVGSSSLLTQLKLCFSHQCSTTIEALPQKDDTFTRPAPTLGHNSYRTPSPTINEFRFHRTLRHHPESHVTRFFHPPHSNEVYPSPTNPASQVLQDPVPYHP